MNLTDLPLEIIGEIASADPRAYHALILAYPRFARSLTLGDRLDFAEKFGYNCRVHRYGKFSSIEWTLHGKTHRTDGPATEWDDGDKEWCVNDKLHRIDGPAHDFGSEKEWWVNGKLHRTDGPATEWSDGYKAWYDNGKLHRIDGPAIEHINGNRYWYIDGIQMSESEFDGAISKLSA